MSEPNVEEIVNAARGGIEVKPDPADVRIQPVSLTSKTVEPVEETDERVVNLIRLGLTEVEARAAIHDVSMF